jgi:putative ABC transport system ATP-binding protein
LLTFIDAKLEMNDSSGHRVGRHYDNYVHALRGASLQIFEGEMVAIMGPSGSGKSTLMHILGCLDRPDSGSVYLGSRPVHDLKGAALNDVRRTGVGFVFQAFNLLPRATVLRNVTLPMLYSKTDPEERERIATDALRAVDLEEKLDTHLSNELSGGQMQRVAIARALVNDPSLIMADEPTGNLDTKTGEAVMDLLGRLHAEGRTIVLITHEADIAAYAERTIQLQDGLILSDTQTGSGGEPS